VLMVGVRVGLWLTHCRQMHRDYGIKGAYERWLQCRIFWTYVTKSIIDAICVI